MIDATGDNHKWRNIIFPLIGMALSNGVGKIKLLKIRIV
jgi:hypothetical protein